MRVNARIVKKMKMIHFNMENMLSRSIICCVYRLSDGKLASFRLVLSISMSDVITGPHFYPPAE